MSTTQTRSARGFTIVELLTVVAIIALLISLVVPALSRARQSAKAGASKADLKALGDALTLFRNENPKEGRGNGLGFPPSARADDPTVAGEQWLFGAQWLYRYLSGADGRGYVAEENVPRDLVLQGFQNPGHEQQDWYAIEPTGANPFAPLDRSGPYIEPGAIRSVQPAALPGGLFELLEDGNVVPNPEVPPPIDARVTEDTFRAPVFLDRFGYPILYYAANPRLAERTNAPHAGSGATPASPKGIYTYMDNGIFTGFCIEGACTYESWKFKNQTSPLQEFGPETIDPNTVLEEPDSFAYYILDRQNFEATARPGQPGVTVPRNRNSFILITPGFDGRYGTSDDVQNW